MGECKIKKAVIREDLLSITGDYRRAIILNQFIYWSERVSDADEFIKKENEIAKNNGEEEKDLFCGWIYKTAEELAAEVMLGLSASQIRRYISDLVELKYISKRNNPKYKWDRTLQYRVNLVNIAKDLKKNGFPLSDYKIDIPDDENSITHECAINNEQEEKRKQPDERTISENTNREYRSENENTDSTDINAFSLNKEKGGKNICFFSGEKEAPSLKKKSRFIPQDYTIEQLREHIDPVIRERITEMPFDGENADVLADNLLEIICRFHVAYYEKFGSRHKILSDMAYQNIADRFLFPPHEMIENGEQYEVGTYLDMMELYLNTEYNKQKKFDKKIELSISHFMSDNIRKHLVLRLFL